MRNLIFITFGWVFFVLGIIGSFLPLLPTTPFLLLSAYFFSKGSDRLYNWLTSLPKIGKPIRDWNEFGVISVRSKIICIFSLALVLGYFIIHPSYSNLLKVALSGILFIVGIFVISRPHQLLDKRPDLI